MSYTVDETDECDVDMIACASENKDKLCPKIAQPEFVPLPLTVDADPALFQHIQQIKVKPNLCL